DLKALASAVGGKKAAMADARIAERRTGFVVGGISPIGQKTPHATVLDETAELYDTVFVSGGRRGFDIELAPADLIAVTSAAVAASARGRRRQLAPAPDAASSPRSRFRWRPCIRRRGTAQWREPARSSRGSFR